MKALVLFSGGQDSTTCLYWALHEYKEVLALNIQYGQRHQAEIVAANYIADMSGTPLKTINLSSIFKQIGNSALLEAGNISLPHPSNPDLPASFVPGRNLIFITIAAMVAYKFKINNIITGVSEADSSGYPDCHQNTLRTLERAIGFGMNQDFILHTPLINLSKKEEVLWSKTIPGCMDALAYSHTCYEGAVPPCGKCPSCKLRAKGFEEAGIPDPLIERLKNEIL